MQFKVSIVMQRRMGGVILVKTVRQTLDFGRLHFRDLRKKSGCRHGWLCRIAQLGFPNNIPDVQRAVSMLYWLRATWLTRFLAAN